MATRIELQTQKSIGRMQKIESQLDLNMSIKPKKATGSELMEMKTGNLMKMA
jgi:hypothetical protein